MLYRAWEVLVSADLILCCGGGSCWVGVGVLDPLGILLCMGLVCSWGFLPGLGLMDLVGLLACYVLDPKF